VFKVRRDRSFERERLRGKCALSSSHDSLNLARLLQCYRKDFLHPSQP
jgi:hypothetical protein